MPLPTSDRVPDSPQKALSARYNIDSLSILIQFASSPQPGFQMLSSLPFRYLGNSHYYMADKGAGSIEEWPKT